MSNSFIDDDVSGTGEKVSAPLREQASAPLREQVSAPLREQVSALVDGELSRSEAAFLLKRMEHDEALKALYLRYQLAGDCLRGNVGALESADFSARLMQKIQAEQAEMAASPGVVASSQVAQSANLRWSAVKRWVGGTAIAASVAAAALFAPQLQRANHAENLPVVAEQSSSDQIPAAPLLLDPNVSLQQVAAKTSTMPLQVTNQPMIQPASMDEFLRLHASLQTSVSPADSAVYLISGSVDAKTCIPADC
jgi:negative regulator of sigma E activity